MGLRKISAIARPIDPRFSTNRIIASITIVLVAGDFLRRLLLGSGLLASAWSACGLGLAVAIAWALCREIDPDRDQSAFVAAGIALVGALLWGTPNLAMLFWTLLAVRVVNRTTGLRATVFDSLAILSLATWLAFRLWWPIGAITAVAFALDGWLDGPHNRHRVFAFLMLAVTLGAGFLGEADLSASGPSLASGAIALLLCLVFVPDVFAAGEMRSLADDTKERLSTKRVRAGQMLVLLIGLGVVFWAGAAGLVLQWPLWSAVLGSSAFLLINSVID